MQSCSFSDSALEFPSFVYKLFARSFSHSRLVLGYSYCCFITSKTHHVNKKTETSSNSTRITSSNILQTIYFYCCQHCFNCFSNIIVSFSLSLFSMHDFSTPDMDVFKVSKSYCLRIAIQIYCYQLAHRLYQSKITMIRPTITRSLCTILIIMLACVRQQQIQQTAPLAAVCAQRLHLWILNQRRKHTRPNINSMIVY